MSYDDRLVAVASVLNKISLDILTKALNKESFDWRKVNVDDAIRHANALRSAVKSVKKK